MAEGGARHAALSVQLTIGSRPPLALIKYCRLLQAKRDRYRTAKFVKRPDSVGQMVTGLKVQKEEEEEELVFYDEPTTKDV